MILQFHTNFDQLAELNSTVSSVQFLSRKEHPEALIAGKFSIVNGIMVSLYRIHGILYFRVADQQLELTDDIGSTLESDGKYRRFRLLRGGNVVVDITYLTPVSDIDLSIDPTPFVEEEHFDFLLFVHNVLVEPGRRGRVWNQ